jgi:hypothetical protein
MDTVVFVEVPENGEHSYSCGGAFCLRYSPHWMGTKVMAAQLLQRAFDDNMCVHVMVSSSPSVFDGWEMVGWRALELRLAPAGRESGGVHVHVVQEPEAMEELVTLLRLFHPLLRGMKQDDKRGNRTINFSCSNIQADRYVSGSSAPASALTKRAPRRHC